ncbi:MAG: tetratricopeptide repeat protein [Candidatus Latescibacteria bacterium]|nr:tetratricopeptide repeat protein [Candidatus Latescibacterota bacterium]
MRRVGAIWGLLGLLFGCTDPAPEPAPLPQRPARTVDWVDITQASGIDFVHISGSPRQHYILEAMGSGAAFFDYDGDGFLDIFAVNGTRLAGEEVGTGNRLYRNRGDGTFADMTHQAGLERVGWGMGCAVADIDRDGDLDLYITYWGANVLYQNQGDGRFIDITEQAGVGDPRWGTSAAFGDIDGDGYVDLYVANYVSFDLQRPPGGGQPCRGWKGLEVFCGPQGLEANADVLYRNSGDGTFVDISAQAGIDRFIYPALGAVFLDYDGDGDQDLYVANDSVPNLLLRNDGAGALVEVGAQEGVAYSEEGRAQAGMGVDAGDWDNDGDWDLFVTNFSDDVNTLYRNDGGTFSDATYGAGLGGLVRPYLGWSTALADFDNDGWLDLFVANGHLYPQLDDQALGLRYAQRNLLYWNDRGTFQLDEGTLPMEGVSRGAAFGDYDNDGDLDLLVVDLNSGLRLLRNDGGNKGQWLGLDLQAADGALEAEGVWVRLWSAGRTYSRLAKRGYGYLSAHDGRVLLGLGQGGAEKIEIHWPSGRLQRLEQPPLGRYLTVREGQPAQAAPYGQSAVMAAVPEQTETRAAVRPAPLVQGAADEYYNRIAQRYGQGRYQEALDQARVALGQYPDDIRFYYMAGVVLYSGMGQYSEAVGVLEKGMDVDSTMVKAVQLLGVVYQSLSQFERAADQFERVQRLDPDHWQAAYRLGLARAHTGADSAAVRALEQAMALAPDEPMPYLQLGRGYRRLGRDQEAARAQARFDRLRPLQERIDRYRQAIAANPDYAPAHDELGLALAAAGRWEEARERLEHAAELDSSAAGIQVNLGNALQMLQQTSTAESCYRRALDLDSELPEAHYGLGMALLAQGRHQDGLEALEEALQLRPDYVKAHINAGILADQLGRPARALAHFRAAVTLAPEDEGALSNLVVFLARMGDFEAAIEQLERAAAQGRVLPRARKYLVQFLADEAALQRGQQNWSEAVLLLRRAVQLTPVSLRGPLAERLRQYEGHLESRK